MCFNLKSTWITVHIDLNAMEKVCDLGAKHILIKGKCHLLEWTAYLFILGLYFWAKEITKKENLWNKTVELVTGKKKRFLLQYNSIFFSSSELVFRCFLPVMWTSSICYITKCTYLFTITKQWMQTLLVIFESVIFIFAV